MKIEREQLEAVVVDLLGPYLGESMARAAVTGQCQQLAIEGPTLDAGQVERVIERLGKGMTLFVGLEKAEDLAAGLRRQLDSEGQL